ncbi:hypothetical protein K2173_005820 [Erythroxylum novogranatense]|uniref:Uncharacterized protein n=1 Tax=Erythroxylum novogranatense TaxID=1862640 RepID=A0AAV8U5W9_9ROSI|nr:hypothetical protein K2173_005820 [Erythroxylum novogranatense]
MGRKSKNSSASARRQLHSLSASTATAPASTPATVPVAGDSSGAPLPAAPPPSGSPSAALPTPALLYGRHSPDPARSGFEAPTTAPLHLPRSASSSVHRPSSPSPFALSVPGLPIPTLASPVGGLLAGGRTSTLSGLHPPSFVPDLASFPPLSGVSSASTLAPPLAPSPAAPASQERDRLKPAGPPSSPTSRSVEGAHAPAGARRANPWASPCPWATRPGPLIGPF